MLPCSNKTTLNFYLGNFLVSTSAPSYLLLFTDDKLAKLAGEVDLIKDAVKKLQSASSATTSAAAPRHPPHSPAPTDSLRQCTSVEDILALFPYLKIKDGKIKCEFCPANSGWKVPEKVYQPRDPNRPPKFGPDGKEILPKTDRFNKVTCEVRAHVKSSRHQEKVELAGRADLREKKGRGAGDEAALNIVRLIHLAVKRGFSYR